MLKWFNKTPIITSWVWPAFLKLKLHAPAYQQETQDIWDTSPPSSTKGHKVTSADVCLPSDSRCVTLWVEPAFQEHKLHALAYQHKKIYISELCFFSPPKSQQESHQFLHLFYMSSLWPQIGANASVSVWRHSNIFLLFQGNWVEHYHHSESI